MIPDGPTKAEVEAAANALREWQRNDTEACKYHVEGDSITTYWIDKAEIPAQIALDAALAVSPLREQVQKLTEENERQRKTLHRIAHPGRLFQDSAVKMSTAARAALSPSYKGEDK